MGAFDEQHKHTVETIENKVEAWPAKVSEDFVVEIAADLVGVIYRLACGYGDSSWQPHGVLETKAADYAALLLIQQTAWRKHKAECSASYEEWKASEESEGYE